MLLMQMNYLDKPWFGAVPPYLQKRMREIEQQRARAERLQQANEVGEGSCGIVVLVSCKLLQAATQFRCFRPL